MRKNYKNYLRTRSIEYVLISMLIFFSFLHLLFALRTDNYFSVDDFAVLNYIRDKNIFEIFRNFVLNGDIFGFGKVFGYLIFKTLFDSFGVNALFFNLAFFVIHTLNLILLYQISKKVSKNIYASFFGALVFNKYYLFYFSNIHEVLVTLFFLLTIYAYIVKKELFKSLLFFIAALLSKEVAFITPFVVSATLFLRGKFKLKEVFPYYFILVIYIFYEISFYVKKLSLPPNDSYKILITPGAFIEGLTFYIPAIIFTFLIILPFVSKKYKSYWLLLCAIFSLMPVIFLVHRREAYYFYLPASILSIFLAMNLPKLTFRSFLFYVGAFLIFGGRSVLPKIAWHTFPNWQKISIQNLVQETEWAIKNNEREIHLGDMNLERDAKLVLQNELIDLFSDDKKLEKFVFKYNPKEQLILVDDKNILE